MGAEQFGRGISNDFLGSNVEVDVQRNTANQFDDDVISEDISTTDYETGEQNISGGQALNVLAKENSGNNADIIVEWTDGTGQIIGSQTIISGLNNASDSSSIRVKSTHVNVKASGSSTDLNLSVNVN